MRRCRSYIPLVILLLIIFVVSLLITPSQSDEYPTLTGRDFNSSREFSSDWYESGKSIVDQVSDSTITEYVTRLVDFRTRYSCTDSNWAAGQWIYDKFLEFGFTDVSYDSFPFQIGSFPCDVQRNIVAVRPGSRYPDTFIVIGGHYDSLTSGSSPCDPDTLAPGADDDASGTAVMIEAARVLAETDLDLSLIFIAFGGEEQGTIGSQYYAEEAFNQGVDIRLMINLDVVAHTLNDTWDVDIWAEDESRPYAQVVAEMARIYTDLIPHVKNGLFAGDNGSFAEFGYKTVYAAETDHSPHWHQCTDTIENISLPYLTDVARMIVPSIEYVSDVPIIPSGFRAVNADDGSTLYLSWDPNPEPDLAGYHVYYGTQPGVYDSVETVTTEHDTLRGLADGTTYDLALSAFDLDDDESFLSEEIEILVTSIPGTPTGITSESLEDRIIVDWDANQGDLDLAGYNLYRWETDGSPDTVLLAFLDTTTTTYTDNLVEPHSLYGYHVTAVDSQVPPNESIPSEEVLGRLATHDMSILLVDNTANGSGGYFMPTDGEVDAFYSDILRNYDVRAIWDESDSASTGRYLMDYDAGIYSTIVWHHDVRQLGIVSSDTTTMRRHLQTGGNLWLSGWQLLAFLTRRAESHYVFDENDFVSRYVGIDSALTTLSSDQDFIGARNLVGGFPSITVDSSRVEPFGALFNLDVLLPPFSGAYSIYSYISSDSAGSEYHGLPVGVASTSSEHGLVFTDFPLYFMEREGAELLVDVVMSMFGEPLSVGDVGILGPPKVFALSQNYPNPFNPSTTITFDLPGTLGTKGKVILAVYDIRGRCVRILVDSELEPGNHKIHWDGRDAVGQSVASGIYLYRLKAGGETSTRKMTIIK